MPSKLKKLQSGFTIIELLIVIAIIGILAGLVLNNFQGAQAKARDTQRKTDINNLHAKLEEYYNENGNYPTEFNITALAGIDAGSLTDPEDVTIDMSGVAATAKPATSYVAAKPDPTAVSQYEYAAYDCTGTGATDTCAKYVLYAWLEKVSGTYAPYEKNSLN